MNKSIKFLDLKYINLKYKEQFLDTFNGIIERGWYILGNEVDTFEKNYATFSNTKYCIGVANGLDALVLSLKSIDVGFGDEVIVPSNTYIATWLAVSQLGALPIPVEPRIDTYNIDPNKIESAISSKTKAILVVNLYGQSAELVKIKKLAEKYNIFLLEDNAQAQGATCNEIPTGSFGIVNATSFYPGKNLGALGDAGAITTNNEDLTIKIKELRNYGSKIKYYNEVKGFNSRLDELQAAFLNLKIANLKNENDIRINLSKIYINRLDNVGDIFLPHLADGCSSVYHIFQIRTKKRDQLSEYLLSKDIGTMIHYPVPPHLQKAYNDLSFNIGDFPIAEEIANTCLSLPMGPHLTPDDIELVTKEIIIFFNNINQ